MRKRTLFALPVLLWCLMGTALAENTGTEKTFCWKISHGKGMVYLLGSLHLCKPDIYPLDKAITEAYEKSECLAVEADMSPEKVMTVIQEFVMKKGIYSDGDSIESHLSEEGYKKFGDFCDQEGYDFFQLGMMQPWLLSLQLTSMKAMGCGFSADAGVDMHFIKRSKSEDKEIKEMESPSFQLDLLSSFPDEIQELVLLKNLEELAELETYFMKIQKAWIEGDLATMDEMLKESVEKEPRLKVYNTKLFDERNVTMTKKIEEYLGTGKPHFVIVGSLHIPGDKGILKLLESAKKYRIEQLTALGRPEAELEAATVSE